MPNILIFELAKSLSMKICIVSPYFSPFIKSSEFMLAQGLGDAGNDVTILTSTAKAPREKAISADALSAEYNFNVKYFRCIDFAENPITFKVFIEVLLENYDIILLREDYPVMCHLAYLASKIKRRPTLLTTERNYDPPGLKGVAIKLLDASINKILRNSVEIYTAHCSAAKHYCIEKLSTRKEIIIIPPSIDTKVFRPLKRKNNFLDGDFRILTVSRLHRYKGLNYLIKSFSLLLQRMDANLYILGKGEEEGALKKLVQDLNLKDNVIFLNISIPNTKMPEVYSECDLYVQPSIIEPFGIAVIEAMACGKPVVGTRIGGMLDTVINEKTGISVPPADVDALFKSMASLIENKKMIKKMGKNARNEALKYDWKKIAEKHIKLMRHIV